MSERGLREPTLTFDQGRYHCDLCGDSQVVLCDHWQYLFKRAIDAMALVANKTKPTVGPGEQAGKLHTLADKLTERLNDECIKGTDAEFNCSRAKRIILTALVAIRTGPGEQGDRLREAAQKLCDTYKLDGIAPADELWWALRAALAAHEAVADEEGICPGCYNSISRCDCDKGALEDRQSSSAAGPESTRKG